jgi:cell division protein FtsB
MSLATLGARNRSKSPARHIPRWVKVLVAAIVLAAVLPLFAVRYLEGYRLNREAVRLAGLKRGLQEKNAIFREEIKLLHTPGYIEKVAREQLGLVRPGEIAVLFVRPPAPPPAPPSLKQDRASPIGRLIRAVKRRLSL